MDCAVQHRGDNGWTNLGFGTMLSSKYTWAVSEVLPSGMMTKAVEWRGRWTPHVHTSVPCFIKNMVLLGAYGIQGLLPGTGFNHGKYEIKPLSTLFKNKIF